MELELQAALDKLEVYRRTQAPGVSDVIIGGSSRGEEWGVGKEWQDSGSMAEDKDEGVWGSCRRMPLPPSAMLSFCPCCALPPSSQPSVSIFADRRPDADKNEEELRVELGQLRDVWRMDQDELKKLHAVRQGGILRGEEHTLQGLP